MKKWIGLMALATAASSASATILYEPFNYASNPPPTYLLNETAPNGQIWAEAGPTTGGRVQIASGSLPQDSTASSSYSGLAVPQGNSINNLNVSQGLRVALGNNQYVSSGTVYYSLGLNVSSLGSLTTAGVFVGGFNNVVGSTAGTISTVGTRLYLRKDADGSDYDIGLAKDAGPNAYTYWDPTPMTLNTTNFVVGGYTIVGTLEGSDDISDMWVNPSPSTFSQSAAPAADLEVNPDVIFPASDANQVSDQTTSLGKDVGVGPAGDPTSYEAVETFGLRTNTALPTMSIDELRIDTTWAGVTAVEWRAAANGNWSGNSNWTNGAAFPNAIGADVTFGTNSTGYNVNLDTPVTVGTIRFNGTNSYTIGGSATLTLQGPANTGISNPAAILVSAGSHSITTPLQLNSNIALTVPAGSTLALSGGATAASGIALSVAGGGAVSLKPASTTALQGLSGLSISGSSKLTLSAAHAAVTTTAVSIDSTSTLDLTNNDLIVDYAPNTASPTGTDTTTGPAVVAAVEASYDKGNWDKAGITTSAAAIGTGRTLAVVDNSQLNNPLPLVDEVTLDSTSVVVKYTWYGDLNLDGVVDNTDSTMMFDGETGWAGGDLNYDGQFNADDWSLFFLGSAESGGANISSVPEPGAMVLLAGLGLLGVRRRRVV